MDHAAKNTEKESPVATGPRTDVMRASRSVVTKLHCFVAIDSHGIGRSYDQYIPEGESSIKDRGSPKIPFDNTWEVEVDERIDQLTTQLVANTQNTRFGFRDVSSIFGTVAPAIVEVSVRADTIGTGARRIEETTHLRISSIATEPLSPNLQGPEGERGVYGFGGCVDAFVTFCFVSGADPVKPTLKSIKDFLSGHPEHTEGSTRTMQTIAGCIKQHCVHFGIGFLDRMQESHLCYWIEDRETENHNSGPKDHTERKTRRLGSVWNVPCYVDGDTEDDKDETPELVSSDELRQAEERNIMLADRDEDDYIEYDLRASKSQMGLGFDVPVRPTVSSEGSGIQQPDREEDDYDEYVDIYQDLLLSPDEDALRIMMIRGGGTATGYREGNVHRAYAFEQRAKGFSNEEYNQYLAAREAMGNLPSNERELCFRDGRRPGADDRSTYIAVYDLYGIFSVAPGSVIAEIRRHALSRKAMDAEYNAGRDHRRVDGYRGVFREDVERVRGIDAIDKWEEADGSPGEGGELSSVED
jgi:hypothetical protein